MQKLFITIIGVFLTLTTVAAQEKRVQNRPYTDLRQFHLGIVVGTHMQDMEMDNVGPQIITAPDGTVIDANVTTDQHNWEPGFNVGVLGELRLNEYFAFRFAPQLYFGTRNMAFRNLNANIESGEQTQITESMKTVYVGANLDLIYAAQRFNNHRPYLMMGIAPMMNLSASSSEYIQLKKSDVFLEVGMGCDFYLPFFKLRPELKFMYGLSNNLDTSRIPNINNNSILPYAKAINNVRSKMIVLSFYFE